MYSKQRHRSESQTSKGGGDQATCLEIGAPWNLVTPALSIGVRLSARLFAHYVASMVELIKARDIIPANQFSQSWNCSEFRSWECMPSFSRSPLGVPAVTLDRGYLRPRFTRADFWLHLQTQVPPLLGIKWTPHQLTWVASNWTCSRRKREIKQ